MHRTLSRNHRSVPNSPARHTLRENERQSLTAFDNEFDAEDHHDEKNGQKLDSKQSWPVAPGGMAAQICAQDNGHQKSNDCGIDKKEFAGLPSMRFDRPRLCLWSRSQLDLQSDDEPVTSGEEPLVVSFQLEIGLVHHSTIDGENAGQLPEVVFIQHRTHALNTFLHVPPTPTQLEEQVIDLPGPFDDRFLEGRDDHPCL